jgi:hypothetical protein
MKINNMWEMGHDNWIKYGWGSGLSKEYSSGAKLHIDFSNYNTPEKILSPSEAAIDAVYKIAENYPGPYTLMCSGGVDSQTMILSWLASGVPFEIMSIRYISDNIFFNEHDLVALSDMAKLHRLTINYQDLDIVSFLENDLTQFNNVSDFGSPQFATHAKFSDFVPSGTILYSGNVLGHNYAQINSYYALGGHRHAINIETKYKKIIPFFLLHTPDLAYSFLNNPEILDPNIFPIQCPPLQKFNGFEKIKEYYDKYFDRITVAQKLKAVNYSGLIVSSRVFDLLFRYPHYTDGKISGGRKFILKRVL